jgi:dienelactone hydrolase
MLPAAGRRIGKARESKVDSALARQKGVATALIASKDAELRFGKLPALETPPHGYVITKPVHGSDIPADYTFVLTRDEIYVPIAVRKPKGDGPFPAITMGSGEGRRGMLHIEEQVERLAPMQDRMIERGYAVAYLNYRNEIPHLYEQLKQPPQNLPDSISGDRRTLKSNPTLDHEDLIAAMRYLQTLPYVDQEAIGAIGVSHSGEIILKAASEYTLAAGVCVEPAAHEFLSVDTGPAAPRRGTEIQYHDVEVARKNADKPKAIERIRRIQTPILIFGREKDHLQGVFRLTHEWMREAGKDSVWYSFDHPVHGYVFVYKELDGSYRPDPIQQEAFEIFMGYFDQHLKHPHVEPQE